MSKENLQESILVKESDGQAFWQPGVQGNCITVKVSPWNVKHSNHTVFLHEMPKGCEVPEHAHENNEEIFICLEGEGIMTINNESSAFKKHDVAYIAPPTAHTAYKLLAILH